MGITGIKEDTDVALLGQCLKLLPLSLDTFGLQTCNECMLLWHPALNNGLFSWAKTSLWGTVALWQIVHGYHVGGGCSNILISECWRVNLFICGAQLYLRKEPWLYTSLAASHSAKTMIHRGYLLPSKIAFFFWPQQGERSLDRFSTVLLQKG